jgi:hypothetical protein
MIIGLCGEQGSGKSTVGTILVDKYGFHKIAFADALKDVVSIMFEWRRDLLEGDTPEGREWRETSDEWWSCRLGMELTPRKALQMIGTNAMRDGFHTDIWLSIVERQLSVHKNVVITDVRFSNEMKMIRNNGGHIVRIEREHSTISEHKSEFEWRQMGVTYTMTNNRAIENLYEEVGHLLFRIVSYSK